MAQAYWRPAPTLEKNRTRFAPIAQAPPAIARLRKPATTTYSMEVAPLSSLKKRWKNCMRTPATSRIMATEVFKNRSQLR